MKKESKYQKKNPSIEAAERGGVLSGGRKHVGGFVTFLRTQGVVGLAVGLVLGAAVSTVANSFINNLVMPPLGFILGSADGLEGLVYSLGKAADGEEAVIAYGAFLNDFINLLVIALVVYLFVKVLRFDRLDVKKT